MEPLVVLEGVSRTYNARGREIRAVDDVSLAVPRGSSLAVVGRSGSGKSTLLSLIGCIDAPTSGRIDFRGARVDELDDRERSRLRNRAIGFVFQSFHLIPQISVRENVEVPLTYSEIDESSWHGRVAAALDSVGLKERSDHRPAELSGGEAQRAAIARAIVAEPDLVLADEPTGNLDSVTGAEIADLLFAFPRTGRTLVLVTHDRALARRADACIELVDGRASVTARS